MQWAGFRKVRGQIRKRLARRLGELDLSDLESYRSYLHGHPDEWSVLDSLCRITIARFYRDRGVFDALRADVFPELVRRALRDGDKTLRCWSVGCASGEEPYTLNIVWMLAVAPDLGAGLALEISATDADERLLDRARRGVFTPSSLKDMPRAFIDAAFDGSRTGYAIRDRFKQGIRFVRQDIRDSCQDGMFHLVLCRNLVFTYFDEPLQRDVLERITRQILPGGHLIVGIHESIPRDLPGLVLRKGTPGVYRMCGTPS